MERNYHISLNQLAEYSVATKKGKTSILKQQVIPNPVLIPWYQGAKGAIKRYLLNVNDTQPILDGIKKISEKKTDNKRQLIDKNVSLEVLKKLINLKLEKHFKGMNYEIIKPDLKSLSLRNINIGISPELIFKTKIKGQIVYGGVKIHISKNKPFSLNQCQQVSTVLMKYIKKNVASTNEIVNSNFCFCIDIFGDRIVTASENDTIIIKEINSLCDEIKTTWPENN